MESKSEFSFSDGFIERLNKECNESITCEHFLLKKEGKKFSAYFKVKILRRDIDITISKPTILELENAIIKFME